MSDYYCLPLGLYPSFNNSCIVSRRTRTDLSTLFKAHKRPSRWWCAVKLTFQIIDFTPRNTIKISALHSHSLTFPRVKLARFGVSRSQPDFKSAGYEYLILVWLERNSLIILAHDPAHILIIQLAIIAFFEAAIRATNCAY